MSGISSATSVALAEQSEDTDANMSTLNSGSTHHTTKSHRHGQARKEKLARALLQRFEEKPAVSNSRRTVNAEHIEYLWRRKLTECLPPELKPRLRAGNGTSGHRRARPKAATRATVDKSTNPRSGEAGVHHSGQEHSSRQRQRVKRRQRERVHVEHYAREVLTSDIEAVTENFKRLKAAGRYPIKAKKPTRVDIRDLDLPPDFAEGQWQEVYFMQVEEAHEKEKVTASERFKVAEGHPSQD
ncbi:hypothetical protein LTR35_009052 [Friedmanniomyces endolithicus]|uniref:Uncharacterized protein n=1 Tax=Friedmanniomyces endolithicus TaxID=329885 RepID=A0AAN6G1F9_9PEZI|nr:hypothetical protein LTR35_009052 [Friedmanniomyces endolithicus]KAK0295381.1 hypothetical protein LTS00_006011 [Friedmanniomyces endolithicus]KAK0327213.1 hypothetical protein LTR82_001976 [Friedmanniomyces endolithicus]KAK1016557.1 hypothetical protein LTR54_003236 [Friedmanniomyces endolithicus]